MPIFRTLPTVPNDTFVCPDDLTTCPVARQAKVYIPYKMYTNWIFLANEIRTEWIAFLKGEIKPIDDYSNEYRVSEMYFPPQKAHASHCEAVSVPGTIQDGTIAAVHSHVGMNVFFSGEDIAHFNWDIEMVVNNRGEIKANGRTKLECGRWHRGEAKIIFTRCEEELSLQDELNKKIMPSHTEFRVT